MLWLWLLFGLYVLCGVCSAADRVGAERTAELVRQAVAEALADYERDEDDEYLDTWDDDEETREWRQSAL